MVKEVRAQERRVVAQEHSTPSGAERYGATGGGFGEMAVSQGVEGFYSEPERSG